MKVLRNILFLSLIFFLHCKEKNTDYYHIISVNDIKLSEPKAGEWRETRKEKFQTYESFLKTKKIIPSNNQNTIYLLPIGDFDSLESKEIKQNSIYLEKYFQLKIKILKPISDNLIPKKARRIIDNHEQLLAGYILDYLLLTNKPKDALVIMAITQKDLYPKPEWNYVFGLASYQKGIGVTSMYRFHDGNLNDSNFNKSLLRLNKISSHEIGHMFGLNHCSNAVCVMNGTNSLPETDKHYARLCSLCQKKLNSSLKYDNQKRLSELNQYFKNNNFLFEAKLTQKDLEILK